MSESPEGVSPKSNLNIMDFTIVTPSFRQLEDLECCIASVADQEGVEVEHIVQDGGTDEFAEFARKMAARWPDRPGYRRVMVSEPDQGMYDAINRGLKKATGAICAYLNCDEQYLPGALTKVKEEFQKYSATEILYAGFLVVDEHGKLLTAQRPVKMFWQHVATSHLPNFTCATFFFRPMLEREQAWFDPNFRACGDAAWALSRLRAKTPARTLNFFTSLFTDRLSSEGMRPSNRGEAALVARRVSRGVRLSSPLWRLFHRGQKLIRGHYRNRSVETWVWKKGETARQVLSGHRIPGVWKRRLRLPSAAPQDAGLCVFAQIPPPLHGQSYMVSLMLDCLTASKARCPRATSVVHVNPRISRDTEDVGSMRPGKMLNLLASLAQAIHARLFRGCKKIYYVPAPAKKAAIFRDLVAVSVLKIFYRRWILHWHSVGLGEYVRGRVEVFGGMGDRFFRPLLGRLFRGSQVSIILKDRFKEEAAIFRPRHLEILPNGIPDPCPRFESEILPRRVERYQSISQALDGKHPVEIRLLHLGLCSEPKGIFLALDFARALQRMYPLLRLELTFAGTFDSPRTQQEFTRRALDVPICCPGPVSGEKKDSLFRNADALMFFSRLPETQGLVVVESFAWGLLPLVHCCKGVESILEGSKVAPVDILQPDLGKAFRLADPQAWRQHYLSLFSLERFCEGIRRIVDEEATDPISESRPSGT